MIDNARFLSVHDRESVEYRGAVSSGRGAPNTTPQGLNIEAQGKRSATLGRTPIAAFTMARSSQFPDPPAARR